MKQISIIIFLLALALAGCSKKNKVSEAEKAQIEQLDAASDTIEKAQSEIEQTAEELETIIEEIETE